MTLPNIDVETKEDSGYRTISVNGTVSPWVSLGLSYVKHDVRTISSIQTPSFRRLPRRSLPINNYSKYTLVASDPRRALTYVQTFTSGTNAGKTASTQYLANCQKARFTVTIPSWGQGNLISRAENHLLQKISTSVSNLSVTIGEAGQTAKLVTSSATKIYNAVRSLRRFDLGGFSRSLGISVSRAKELRFGHRKKLLVDQLWDLEKDTVVKSGKVTLKYGDQRILHVLREEQRVQDFLFDTWLEYKYGWTPLLSDVYDQAKALATHMVERSNAVRYESVKLRDADHREVIVPGPIGNQTWTATGVREEEQRVSLKVWYSIPEEQIRAQDTFGLNNPAVLAWELLPFSFVADWFIPIGSALENLTATNGLVFQKGVVTHLTMRNVKYRMFSNGKRDTFSDGFGVSTGECLEERTEFQMTRASLGSFPRPNFPEFRTPASWQQALTSIALVNSLFLHKK